MRLASDGCQPSLSFGVFLIDIFFVAVPDVVIDIVAERKSRLLHFASLRMTNSWWKAGGPLPPPGAGGRGTKRAAGTG